MAADWTKVREHIFAEWEKTIVPTLSDYIRVPCQSPHYDADWATNGLLEKAMQVLIDWLAKQPVKGMKYELLEEPGRTPFLFIEIEGTTPAASNSTVLLYAHMDKQPPLLPWGEGLDPYTPIIRDGKLYGRGGADDGYGLCASIASIAALQGQGIPHARCVVIIEACEESSSFDLPHYIEKCKGRIGSAVDLIVCLDSGAMSYDQLWITNSLRGVVGGVLTVKMLEEAMHSGIAGGVVPDAFMVARKLLDRIEDPLTGDVKIPELFCEVPASIQESIKVLDTLGDAYIKQYPFVEGANGFPGSNSELGIRNLWRPCLTVVGADLPAVAKAGNVIRSAVQLKLSIRCPPNVDAVKACEAVQKVLEANPPFGAQVTFAPESAGSGWYAPALKPWMSAALSQAAQDSFGKDFAEIGLGFSVPFMKMLSNLYPSAQFLVTGVLGPQSNAHGPNEFLHIEFAKHITCAVSRVLAAHHEQLQLGH